MTGRRPSVAEGAIERRAEARWARLLSDQPELAPAIELQRRLIRIQLAALRAISAQGTPRVDPERAVTNLEGGRPALAGDPPRPPDLLGPLAWTFARELDDSGTSGATAHLAEILGARKLDGLSIVAASLARDTCAFRSAADQLGLSPDLLWLVGEMAAAPFAHACAEAVSAMGGSRVRAALSNWRRGCCPTCGSWPALAEDDGHRWMLRCSFCATGWEALRESCIYCGARHESPPASDSASAGSLFAACDTCQKYLKVVIAEDPLTFPFQAIEDLATARLDAVAIERGYHRPPLVASADFQGIQTIA